MKCFSLLFLVLINIVSCIQENKPLTINLTGDVILSRGVADELSIHGDTILNRIISPFLLADFNVINLETVLTSDSEQEKEGYSFRYDPAITNYLKVGGVTHASIANNHSFDFSNKGYRSTQVALKGNFIEALGVHCKPNILSKNGKESAILAVSLTTNNSHLCIKDEVSLVAVVQNFRNKNPDIPLVIYIHWGLEYQLNPEKWQQELAYKLIDIGVDAIIGHHPHVFQTIELYKEKPIIYSLGNFVADAYLPNTTKGIIASLKIEVTGIKTALIPVNLNSYFPNTMTERQEIKMLSNNLNYSSNICFYKSDDQWLIKSIDSVDFEENASDWLFHNDDQYGILISKLRNGKHKLIILNNGNPEKSMMIHGELSQIEVADITNDGNVEILLGITKKVNFDQRNKKRINIFKIEGGSLQTVWLGTKFLNDLISFDVIEKDRLAYLQTLEIDSTETKYFRIYEWDQFGFALQNQLK